MNAPPDCRLCPRLVESRKCVVNGSGLDNATVLIVAQNPGAQEEEEGVPLVGWSGRRLNWLLEKAGIDGTAVYRDNIVKCRPPRMAGGDAAPTVREVAACRPFLEARIRALQPELIITLGAPALRWFLPGLSLAKVHGQRLHWAGAGVETTVVPMYHPAAAAPGRNPALAAVLIADFTRLKAPPPSTAAHYQEATTEEVRKYLRYSAEFAFDLETTSAEWQGTFQARRVTPIGYSVSLREGEGLYCFDSLVGIKDILERSTLVCHNAKFEYEVLRGVGITPEALHCTKLMAYVLRRPSTHLKDLSWAEFGVVQTRYDAVDWEDKGAVVQYGAADADMTWRLYSRFSHELLAHGLWEVYTDIELPLVPVIGDMELRGVLLDTEPLAALRTTLLSRLPQLEAELEQHVPGVNWRSHVQVSEALYGEARLRVKEVKALKTRSHIKTLAPGLALTPAQHTASGQGSVAKEHLYNLPHPAIAALLEYGAAQKLLFGDLTRLPALVQEDGRIHATFHQAGGWEEQGGAGEAPETGRLASSGPNLQNVTSHGDPKRPYVAEWGKQVRRAFVAPPGYMLVQADLGQEEPRIWAALSGDARLLDRLEHGDIYLPVATVMFGRPITRDEKEERQAGKRGWLAWSYGAGVPGMRRAAPWLTATAAKHVLESLDNDYPAVVNYRSEVLRRLQRDGYAVTYFGRRRYLPAIWSKDRKAVEAAQREAVNMPIQGTAADVLKLAMARVHVPLKEHGARIVLQVHDELVVEVPGWEVEYVTRLLRGMTEGLLPVRLPVEVKTGRNWTDMEPV